MNTQLMIDYLQALDANNNREWYHAHKDDYKNANAEFESFLQALMLVFYITTRKILHLSW